MFKKFHIIETWVHMWMRTDMERNVEGNEK